MEFYEHRDAAAALAAMNGRKILGKVSCLCCNLSLCKKYTYVLVKLWDVCLLEMFTKVKYYWSSVENKNGI